MPPRKRLGQLLTESKVIDEHQLQSALGHQKQWGGKLGGILVQKGFCKEAEVVRVLAQHLSMPVVQLAGVKIDPRAVKVVSRQVAEKLHVFAYELSGTGRSEVVTIAMSDPTDLSAVDQLAFHTGKRIKPMLCGDSEIVQAIQENYVSEATPAPGQPRAGAPGAGAPGAGAPGAARAPGGRPLPPLGPPPVMQPVQVVAPPQPKAPSQAKVPPQPAASAQPAPAASAPAVPPVLAPAAPKSETTKPAAPAPSAPAAAAAPAPAAAAPLPAAPRPSVPWNPPAVPDHAPQDDGAQTPLDEIEPLDLDALAGIGGPAQGSAQDAMEGLEPIAASAADDKVIEGTEAFQGEGSSADRVEGIEPISNSTLVDDAPVAAPAEGIEGFSEGVADGPMEGLEPIAGHSQLDEAAGGGAGLAFEEPPADSWEAPAVVEHPAAHREEPAPEAAWESTPQTGTEAPPTPDEPHADAWGAPAEASTPFGSAQDWSAGVEDAQAQAAPPAPAAGPDWADAPADTAVSAWGEAPSIDASAEDSLADELPADAILGTAEEEGAASVLAAPDAPAHDAPPLDAFAHEVSAHDAGAQDVGAHAPAETAWDAAPGDGSSDLALAEAVDQATRGAEPPPSWGDAPAADATLETAAVPAHADDLFPSESYAEPAVDAAHEESPWGAAAPAPEVEPAAAGWAADLHAAAPEAPAEEAPAAAAPFAAAEPAHEAAPGELGDAAPALEQGEAPAPAFAFAEEPPAQEATHGEAEAPDAWSDVADPLASAPQDAAAQPDAAPPAAESAAHEPEYAQPAKAAWGELPQAEAAIDSHTPRFGMPLVDEAARTLAARTSEGLEAPPEWGEAPADAASADDAPASEAHADALHAEPSGALDETGEAPARTFAPAAGWVEPAHAEHAAVSNEEQAQAEGVAPEAFAEAPPEVAAGDESAPSGGHDSVMVHDSVYDDGESLSAPAYADTAEYPPLAEAEGAESAARAGTESGAEAAGESHVAEGAAQGEAPVEAIAEEDVSLAEEAPQAEAPAAEALELESAAAPQAEAASFAATSWGEAAPETAPGDMLPGWVPPAPEPRVEGAGWLGEALAASAPPLSTAETGTLRAAGVDPADGVGALRLLAGLLRTLERRGVLDLADLASEVRAAVDAEHVPQEPGAAEADHPV